MKSIMHSHRSKFSLARLHVDSLKTKLTVRKLEDALKALPKTLSEESEVYDPAYEEAMTRVFAQPKDYQDIARRIFSWVFCAKQPLTPVELQTSLAVFEGDSEIDKTNFIAPHDIFALCAGLSVLDEENNAVRLVHYTTQEYLVRTETRWLPNASLALARTGIAYLSFKVFNTVRCTDNEELAMRLLEHPLLDYAGTNWGHRARDVEEKADLDSIAALHEEIKSSSKEDSSLDCAFQILFTHSWDKKTEIWNPEATDFLLAAQFGLELFCKYAVQALGEIDYRDL